MFGETSLLVDVFCVKTCKLDICYCVQHPCGNKLILVGFIDMLIYYYWHNSVLKYSLVIINLKNFSLCSFALETTITLNLHPFSSINQTKTKVFFDMLDH